jgi:hypothetical protein
MTWKGICPIVQLNQNVYEKGVALSKTAMKAIEQRLQRNPELPQMGYSDSTAYWVNIFLEITKYFFRNHLSSILIR